MKKTTVLLLVLALMAFSAGCSGREERGGAGQKVSDTPEVKNNVTDATNTSHAAESPAEAQTDLPDGTVTPTETQGNPYAEWEYIDPSLVVVSGEEDEKIINI